MTLKSLVKKTSNYAKSLASSVGFALDAMGLKGSLFRLNMEKAVALGYKVCDNYIEYIKNTDEESFKVHRKYLKDKDSIVILFVCALFPSLDVEKHAEQIVSCKFKKEPNEAAKFCGKFAKILTELKEEKSDDWDF